MVFDLVFFSSAGSPAVCSCDAAAADDTATVGLI